MSAPPSRAAIRMAAPGTSSITLLGWSRAGRMCPRTCSGRRSLRHGRKIRSSADEALRRIVLGTVLAVVLSGCATFKNTPQQDFARQAWDNCPHMANIELDYIEPSGMIHWRWVNSNAGADEHWACITKYYQEHPQPAVTR